MLKGSMLPFNTNHNPYQQGYGQFFHEIQKNRIEAEIFNCARSSTSIIIISVIPVIVNLHPNNAFKLVTQYEYMNIQNNQNKI